MSTSSGHAVFLSEPVCKFMMLLILFSSLSHHKNRGTRRQQPSKRRDINVDDVVRSPPEQAANSPRAHSRSPRKAAGRVDPHEILRRHQEKRRQEELLEEAASMNTATSQHYQQQANMQAQQSQTPSTNTYRLAPISASANGEVIMDGRARQAALARYRKSQLKPIIRTGGVSRWRRGMREQGTMLALLLGLAHLAQSTSSVTF